MKYPVLSIGKDRTTHQPCYNNLHSTEKALLTSIYGKWQLLLKKVLSDSGGRAGCRTWAWMLPSLYWCLLAAAGLDPLVHKRLKGNGLEVPGSFLTLPASCFVLLLASEPSPSAASKQQQETGSGRRTHLGPAANSTAADTHSRLVVVAGPQVPSMLVSQVFWI